MRGFGGGFLAGLGLKVSFDKVGLVSYDARSVIADVAELADAQASGACGGNPMEVRVLSSAIHYQFKYQDFKHLQNFL